MSNSAPLANLNGRILPLAEATIPATDRGFLFGDGIYEVLHIMGGRPWQGDEHFERLAQSLHSIALHGVDLDRLRQRMTETIQASGFTDATVYLHITRGAPASRSHPFPQATVPLEFLFVKEFVDPYGEARIKGVKGHLYPDLRWQRCDIKSTNLLANVLANQAAVEVGAHEAILYRTDGTLTEGSHSSLFGFCGTNLVTAPSGPWILPGVTRKFVLRLASKLDLPVEERFLHRDELATIPELFFTSTTSQVLPIVNVDELVVGDGKPGPITRQLQEAFANVVAEFVKK